MKSPVVKSDSRQMPPAFGEQKYIFPTASVPPTVMVATGPTYETGCPVAAAQQAMPATAAYAAVSA